LALWLISLAMMMLLLGSCPSVSLGIWFFLKCHASRVPASDNLLVMYKCFTSNKCVVLVICDYAMHVIFLSPASAIEMHVLYIEQTPAFVVLPRYLDGQEQLYI